MKTRTKCKIKEKCAFRDYATKYCTVLESPCEGTCPFHKTNQDLRRDLRNYPNPSREENDMMLRLLEHGDG